ncbi:MAG: T9SS type A sorting domain-containing protein [Flavobacteriales bacterium]|nr:T9SS type A sorting domain-containing protein [Flavobacteriales bacterium]
MTRNLTLLGALVSAFPVAAQVVNGSFEQAGQFSLAGWEWTCSTPSPVVGGAPAAGNWAVSKEAGQTQGCFPSYLYQRLPGFADGEVLHMAAWLRCDAGPACLGAYMGLGRINNGLIELEENTGASDTSWTYVMFSDTVELATDDTLVLVLNAGMIGGPIQPGMGQFDDVSVTLAQGVDENDRPVVLHYPDPATDVLRVSMDRGDVRGVRILDAQGRLVRREPGNGGRLLTLDVAALAAGPHVAVVELADGAFAFRFIKQ